MYLTVSLQASSLGNKLPPGALAALLAAAFNESYAPLGFTANVNPGEHLNNNAPFIGLVDVNGKPVSFSLIALKASLPGFSEDKSEGTLSVSLVQPGGQNSYDSLFNKIIPFENGSVETDFRSSGGNSGIALNCALNEIKDLTTKLLAKYDGTGLRAIFGTTAGSTYYGGQQIARISFVLQTPDNAGDLFILGSLGVNGGHGNAQAVPCAQDSGVFKDGTDYVFNAQVTYKTIASSMARRYRCISLGRLRTVGADTLVSQAFTPGDYTYDVRPGVDQAGSDIAWSLSGSNWLPTPDAVLILSASLGYDI